VRRLLSIVCLLVGAAGMSACLGLAYESPTAPTASVTPQPTPASISTTVALGIGNGAGRAFVGARVFDASGRAVPNISVRAMVDSGTIAAGSELQLVPLETSIILAADGGGLAQFTISGRGRIGLTLSAPPASSQVVLIIP